MSEAKQKILVVDDDPFILRLLEKFLIAENYHVLTATNGEDALSIFQEHSPSLVILDVMMPRLNGHETLKEIRRRSRSRRVPIMMLTALGEVEQKVEGFELGADDYITKPFNLEELKARIKAHIRRVLEEQAINPLTGLPGNVVIRKKIDELLTSEELWAVLYVDLDNFKAYNDIYGFAAGDEILTMTAKILDKSIQLHGNDDDFLGHIGGDDYIIITNYERMNNIVESIFNQFDDKVKSFYKNEDIERGYLVTKDRKGEEQRFPIMSISIGGVTNQNRDYNEYLEIAEVAAEMKKYAKGLESNKFAVDRRKS